MPGGLQLSFGSGYADDGRSIEFEFRVAKKLGK